MKKIFLGLGFATLLVGRLHATTYWVATNGDDANPGTSNSPFATPYRAATNSALAAGDTIYVRGGVYSMNLQLKLGKNGTAASRLTFSAYPGEKPVFDFTALRDANESNNRGFYINRSYWT